jgi:hypothetical protein
LKSDSKLGPLYKAALIAFQKSDTKLESLYKAARIRVAFQKSDYKLESLFIGLVIIKKARRRGERGGKVIGDVGNAIDLFWTYTITFLGVALSFGLLLNLFGYACIVDPEAGLRVDAIQELRKEKKFRTEANQFSSPQPPSILPK